MLTLLAAQLGLDKMCEQIGSSVWSPHQSDDANYKQESCAIAKMTARCALYKWIEWAVVEIWLFEIIQDGGLPPTWIWCNRK